MVLGDGISDLRITRQTAMQRFRSVDHFLAFFRRWFGPTIAAFERVGPDGEEALADDLRAVVDRYNRAGQRAAVLASAYAEVVAVRA